MTWRGLVDTLGRWWRHMRASVTCRVGAPTVRATGVGVATAVGDSSITIGTGGVDAYGIQLPTVEPSAARPAVTGTTWNVSTDAEFDTALAGAVYGDRIVLASSATFTSNHVIPAKSGWADGLGIVVETDQTASLPTLDSSGRWAGPGATQTRVTLTSHGALMPELHPTSATVTGTALPALQFAEGSAGWYFRGLRFVWPFSGSETIYGMVRIGESKSSTAYNVEANLPHHVVFQQCIWHTEVGVQYALAVHAGHVAIVNCWLFTTNPGSGEAKGIWIGNSPGRVLVENNYVAANGENCFIGGSDAVIPGMLPTDVTFRWNWCHKPTAWATGSTLTKNTSEQKNGIRVLWEYNIFDGCRGNGQSGQSLTLKTANQDGGMYWCESGQVIARYNLHRNISAGLEFLAEQKNGATDPANYQGAVPMHDIAVYHNVVLVDTSGTWTGAWRHILSGAPYSGGGPNLNWHIDHNTFLGPAALFDTMPSGLGGSGIAGVVMTNNIFGYPLYAGLVSSCLGFKGSSLAEGNASLAVGYPGITFTGNAITSRPASSYNNYAGNYFPATDSGNINADGSLPVGSAYLAGGSMDGADGLDNGADLAAVLANTNGVETS